jgi:arylsulfatase
MKKITFAFAALGTATLAAQQSQKPNIIIILVDDMGYSDPGCFGGEINTPNLDYLAENGLRLTQFYNASRSCPSRAALLTGRYPHVVGITAMGQSLTKDCVTIPEVLKTAGYNTSMTGKWHLSRTTGRSSNEEQMQWLAHRADYGNFAPLNSYPCNRGFDEHFGTIWGVCDFFDPFSLVHNEEQIKTVPSDFYMTDYVTDKTIELIDADAKKPDPFFMYVSYTAPHWPLHAKPEDIAKYKGKYDMGWDELRKNRYDKMVQLGLIDQAQTPRAKNESGKIWENELYKNWEAANMEVHAAMLDCVDQGIGRIIDKLKETGVYENTIIFFMSDNGASSERYLNSGFDRPSLTRDGTVIRYPAERPEPGGQTTFNYLGEGWAGAINTPYRYWKSQSFYGGTATPAIVHWPAGLKTNPGSIVHHPIHIIDMMATCLDLADATYPANYNGNDIKPMTSTSFVPILENKTLDQNSPIYWEHEGGRAIRVGDWKLVSLKKASWQLFNMKTDLSETNDVSIEYPDKVRELKTLWNTWALSMGLTVSPEPEDTPLELMFYYPFDENLRDNSSNNYILQSPNGNSYSNGKYGKSLLLNGTNQYLDLNTEGIVNPAVQQYSVCGWVYNTATMLPGVGNLYEEIILAQKDGSVDATGRISLFTRLDASKTYFSNFLGGNANLSRPNVFDRNKWIHVAVVCNPVTSAITYYVDGVKDTTVYAKNGFEKCSGGFRIGGHKAGRNYWTGQIDELYFFKGLLSEYDVNRIMNNTYFNPNGTMLVSNKEIKVVYDDTSKKLRVISNHEVNGITIYTSTGNEIKQTTNSSELSMEGFQAGVYVAKIRTKYGERNTQFVVAK